MRYIGLDISTNTGYAIFDKDTLVDYGVFTIKVQDYKADVKTFKDFPESYPLNFLKTSDEIAKQCIQIIAKNNIDMVIIEHSEKGKQRLSQRLLEWTHMALIKELILNKIPFKYILVNDWRNAVKCYIKYWPDHQDWNKKVKGAKKKAEPTKTGMLVPKIDGKRVSAINQKKLSVIIANKDYGISIKDNNIADAINMAHAANILGMVSWQ
jgi:hypothetical protein